MANSVEDNTYELLSTKQRAFITAVEEDDDEEEEEGEVVVAVEDDEDDGPRGPPSQSLHEVHHHKQQLLSLNRFLHPMKNHNIHNKHKAGGRAGVAKVDYFDPDYHHRPSKGLVAARCKIFSKPATTLKRKDEAEMDESVTSRTSITTVTTIGTIDNSSSAVERDATPYKTTGTLQRRSTISELSDNVRSNVVDDDDENFDSISPPKRSFSSAHAELIFRREQQRLHGNDDTQRRVSLATDYVDQFEGFERPQEDHDQRDRATLYRESEFRLSSIVDELQMSVPTIDSKENAYKVLAEVEAATAITENEPNRERRTDHEHLLVEPEKVEVVEEKKLESTPPHSQSSSYNGVYDHMVITAASRVIVAEEEDGVSVSADATAAGANDTYEKDNCKEEEEKKKNVVTFTHLTIREYPIIIGDNPSCTAGIPLSMDWKHVNEKTNIDIEKYETKRGPLRKTTKTISKNELIRPSHLRNELLKKLGYSLKERQHGTKLATIARNQRRATVNNLSRHKQHERFENLKRATTNFINPKRKARHNEYLQQALSNGDFSIGGSSSQEATSPTTASALEILPTKQTAIDGTRTKPETQPPTIKQRNAVQVSSTRKDEEEEEDGDDVSGDVNNAGVLYDLSMIVAHKGNSFWTMHEMYYGCNNVVECSRWDERSLQSVTKVNRL